MKAQKDLADKLVELENKVHGNGSNTGAKYKATNDKLTEKCKELKCARDELKKVTEREKNLLESMCTKNNKIAELEAEVTRMKIRLEHKNENYQTQDDKKDPTENIDDERKAGSKKMMKKCQY